MATIETWFESRIEFDYDQEKVDRDDFDRLEEDEEAGRTLRPPRDVIDEIEDAVMEAGKLFDVEIEVNNGGPAWGPYIELRGQDRAGIEQAAAAIENLIRRHDYAELT